jgi:signal transduction histidine kinase
MRADETPRKYSLLSLWEQHPFRLHIAVFFTTMVLLFGVVLAWSSYVQGRNLVLSSTENVFERIEREIHSEILHMHTLVEAVVNALSGAPITDAGTFKSRMQSLEGMAEVLDRYAMLESIYIGYYNGDFFQLHALRNDADRKRFSAPRHAAYRLQSIERGTRQGRFRLLDPALNEISDLPAPPGHRFDPRVRPWYVEAMRTRGPVQTAPYLFFTTQEVGQTIARRAEHGRAVVGADITLKQLSETLALARPSPSSQLAVFGEDRSVIAQSEPLRIPAVDAKGNPAPNRIEDLSPVLAAATQVPHLQAKIKNIEVNAREWMVRIAPVAQTAKGMTYLVVATPRDELLTEARATLQRNLWLALFLVLLSAPLTWWIAHRIAANLNTLTDQAAAIRRFNFDKPAPLRSRITEILDLGFVMGQMRETISKFMDITTALSAEHHFDRLLRRVLQEARDIAGAEGGVIYLLAEDGRTLKPADQNWNEGITAGDENLPDLSLGDESNPVARAARSTEAHGAYALAPERPAGLEFLDARFDRQPAVLVALPLLDRGGAVMGVLCLFLRGRAAQPSQERLALVHAFAGAGGVAIDNQRMISTLSKTQKSLEATGKELRDHRDHLEELVKERTLRLQEVNEKLSGEIEERIQRERELQGTLQELAVAKEQAEVADHLKSAFLATMSHELRTPLNSIIGFTGIILHERVGPLNDEQKKQLNMVRRSSQHLLALINDVLDISKIEAGQLQVAHEKIDLRQIIEKVEQGTRPLADVKGLELSFEISPEIETIRGDSRRVEQILLNLLSNAIKFTEKGSVRIVGELDECNVIVKVIDTGMGIKAEDMETLFKSFRQIDSGISRKYDGTGLGLSISKKLVELMGGKIWVTSTWGAGSTFGFSLPREQCAQRLQAS